MLNIPNFCINTEIFCILIGRSHKKVMNAGIKRSIYSSAVAAPSEPTSPHTNGGHRLLIPSLNAVEQQVICGRRCRYNSYSFNGAAEDSQH